MGERYCMSDLVTGGLIRSSFISLEGVWPGMDIKLSLCPYSLSRNAPREVGVHVQQVDELMLHYTAIRR